MLVDDCTLFRECLKVTINQFDNLKVLCEASDGEDCIDKLRMNPIDIVLLDINMPIKNGIETMQFIRKKKIPIKVIVLTNQDDLNSMVELIDLGVKGYLLKECDIKELIEAIKSVSDGKQYIMPKLIPMFNKYLITQDEDKNMILSLTNRELELLKAIAQGMANKDIAESMNISERTVKNHISHIFKKINVEDRTQAAVFAIKNDIIRIK